MKQIESQTPEGYPMKVVQWSSRGWFCAIEEPGKEPAIILDIKTSSPKVAEQKCKEAWGFIHDNQD